jgi:integrase
MVSPLQASLLGQQQKRVREVLKFPADFVLHSLRHTFGTRLGEAGADAFTIMRLMGHSTVTVSQRYVHPSPEAVELAFGRLVELNPQKVAKELAHSNRQQHWIFSKPFRFNVPGWRNRQTQRT